jgi:enediyne biosynthesis protein E4
MADHFAGHRTTAHLFVTARKLRTVLTVSALGALASSAHAQTCIDGICFVDRGWSGEIALGNYGGGIAVIDFDRDGWQDLYIGASDGRVKGLFQNVPDAANPGRRTFVNVVAGSGLDDAENTRRFSAGVVAGDLDNDGDDDLVLTGFDFGDRSSGLVYRNDTVPGGPARFTNISLSAGIRIIDGMPQSNSLSDFDLDGDLDIMIGSAQTPTTPIRLLRNRGDATFEWATPLVPNTGSAGSNYAQVWVDFDEDGDPDVAHLAAGNTIVLLRNDFINGERVFVNVASQVGFTVLGPAPMGITHGDYDNDGDRDLAVSNGSYGIYYRNDSGLFTQVTPFQAIWAWGVIWIDVDNDGDLDHYQCGSVGRGASFDALRRNLGGWNTPSGGSFDDISDAMNSTFSTSQFAVQIDWNNDGRSEIVSTNPFGANRYVAVYENISTTPGHWLKVKLVGDGVRVNRSAVGAVLRVHAGGMTQTRELSSGTSSTSTEDLRQNFGLASATAADWIEVVWPRTGTIASRTTRVQGPIAADRIIEIAAPCAADFNADGSADFFDYLDFVAAFAAGDLSTDVNGDFEVDFFDYLDFVEWFDRAC